ncbi:MAG TPA: acyltransferase [Actinomycetes bacterium]
MTPAHLLERVAAGWRAPAGRRRPLVGRGPLPSPTLPGRPGAGNLPPPVQHEGGPFGEPAPVDGRQARMFVYGSLLALALLAPVLVWLDLRSPVRALALLLFFCLAPGAALTGFLRLRDWAVEASLALALSVAADAAVAQIMLWLHVWSPRGGVLALAVLAAPPLVLHIHRAWATAPGGPGRAGAALAVRLAARRPTAPLDGGAALAVRLAARRPTAPRIIGVDGLRAVAAGSILVYHCWRYSSPDGPPVGLGPLSRYLFPNLPLGVTVFFVLSGFLLYRPFASALIHQERRPSLSAYLRSRALRILPAYWAILVLSALVFGSTLVRDRAGALQTGSMLHRPWLLVRNALLVHGYSPSGLLTGIGPAWSLAVEVVFYLVLPLLAVLAWRLARGARTPGALRLAALAPLLVMLVVGLSGKVVAALLMPGSGPSPGWDADWPSVLERSFWANADLFAPGMLLAVLSVDLADGRLTLPVWWRRAAALGIPLIGIPTALLTAPDPSRGWQLSIHAYGAIMAVPAGLLVALVVLPAGGSGEPSRLARLLQRRPLAAVGTVSYSLFLWHEPLVRWMNQHGLTVGGVGGFVLNLIALATASGFLAALTYRYVEAPALRRKRPRRDGPDPREAPPGARPPSTAAPSTVAEPTRAGPNATPLPPRVR